MPKNIFIGGTGRSGTTVLAKTLGSLPEIYTFPRELRFHVDPSGLSQLWRSGSIAYNPPASGAALKAFVKLMTIDLVRPGRQPCRGFNFHEYFGESLYIKELEKLLEEVVLHRYRGFQLYADPLHQVPYKPRAVRGLLRSGIRLYGRLFDSANYKHMKSHGYEYTSDIYEMKYFENPAVLAQLLGSYFETLTTSKVVENNAAIFCEHTPGNGFESQFLANSFPNSCLVWRSRNPIDVALSYRDQVWAPNNLEAICKMLQCQYQKWHLDKALLDACNYQYLEVKLEDLTERPNEIFSDILKLAGLEINLPDFSHLTKRRHSSNRDASANDREILFRYFPELL